MTVFGNNNRAASLAVSDHRPVWARFQTDLPDDDASDVTTASPATSWDELKAPPVADSSSPNQSPTSLININTASKEKLESLYGVGPVIADRIIAGRPYVGEDDLIRVKGIGPKKMASIRPTIRVK